MNYEEFHTHIRHAGLKLNEFADLMKMSHVALSNYRKKGEVPSHLAVIAVLLEELEKGGIDYRAALATIKIAPKKARGIVFKGKSSKDEQKDL